VVNVDKSFAFDMMTDFCQITTWVAQYLQHCWTRKTWPLSKSYLLTIYSLCEPYKIIIICTYHLDLTQHHPLCFNLWIIVNMPRHQQMGLQNQCNEFSCFEMFSSKLCG
jgi:hypothetical protein